MGEGEGRGRLAVEEMKREMGVQTGRKRHRERGVGRAPPFKGGIAVVM